MGLLIYVVIGAIVGGLAAQMMKGESFGIIADVAVGVVGGLIGGWVFGAIGIYDGGLIGSIITAIIGAAALIAGLRVFRRAYPA